MAKCKKCKKTVNAIVTSTGYCWKCHKPVLVKRLKDLEQEEAERQAQKQV